jgi:hypothetical protein
MSHSILRDDRDVPASQRDVMRIVPDDVIRGECGKKATTEAALALCSGNP